jgi:dienelactone hydrolase
MNRLRSELSEMLGIPQQRMPLEPEPRGTLSIGEEVVVEKWIWNSEPGSRVTSLLYLPRNRSEKIPGVVITNGHGGSKNSEYTQYAGQLYAKLGIACLAHDTIGEEERHISGEMGTRAHDQPEAIRRADEAGRLMLGKMIFDASRALDFLGSRADVDAQRLGVAGNSLGGTVAMWLAALDERLKAAIISGSGFSPLNADVCKPCCAVPSQRMSALCDYNRLLSLAAPHCAVLGMNGECDEIVTQGREEYWQQHRAVAAQCALHYKRCGASHKFKDWFQPEGGHRAYHLHPQALLWLSEHLELSQWSAERIRQLPTITLQQWFEKHGLEWPENSRRLYWVERHHKGGVFVDGDIAPVPWEKLQCLSRAEIGAPQYTLEGWLDSVTVKNPASLS